VAEFFGSERLERYRAFLNRDPVERPLLGIGVGFLMPQAFPTLAPAIPIGPVAPEDIRVDLFLEDCEALYQAHCQIDDDYPFVGTPFAYVPWMEAIMGCPIYASENSMWAEPAVEGWDTWHWERPVLAHNAWAQKLLELLDALLEHSAGRYQVSPALMRGPADILSAMRGARRFVLDFYDFPDQIRRAAELCAEVWVEVGQAKLERVPVSSNGYMAALGGLRTWAPDKIIWLQEDAMALLSPRLYREFFLPLDRHICRQFPYISFHLHGSALWSVDDLARVPELDVLELNSESARFDVEGTFDGWKKTQQYKPLVIWKEFDGDLFWPWLQRVQEELSPHGLSLQFTVNTVEEGLEIKARFLEMAWG